MTPLLPWIAPKDREPLAPRAPRQDSQETEGPRPGWCYCAPPRGPWLRTGRLPRTPYFRDQVEPIPVDHPPVPGFLQNLRIVPFLGFTWDDLRSLHDGSENEVILSMSLEYLSRSRDPQSLGVYGQMEFHFL